LQEEEENDEPEPPNVEEGITISISDNVVRI